MEEALRERGELKMRVHSYISEVAKIEKIMAAKVKHMFLICFTVICGCKDFVKVSALWF